MIGQRFTRLVVVTPAERLVEPTGHRRPRWLCRCDCGNEKAVDQDALKRGATRSCGCLQHELHIQKITKHGHTTQHQLSRTWITWNAMLTRCSEPRHDKFKHYGGRGITVCERWKVFESFLADMGERPEGKTLDREDVNGHYEPGNCRWATQKEQMRNTRRNRALAQ